MSKKKKKSLVSIYPDNHYIEYGKASIIKNPLNYPTYTPKEAFDLTNAPEITEEKQLKVKIDEYEKDSTYSIEESYALINNCYDARNFPK